MTVMTDISGLDNRQFHWNSTGSRSNMILRKSVLLLSGKKNGLDGCIKNHIRPDRRVQKSDLACIAIQY